MTINICVGVHIHVYCDTVTMVSPLTCGDLRYLSLQIQLRIDRGVTYIHTCI